MLPYAHNRYACHTNFPTIRSQLPPELWSMVLHNFRSLTTQDDLIYSWTECRHVSNLFEEEIQTLFLLKHLPKVFYTALNTFLYQYKNFVQPCVQR